MTKTQLLVILLTLFATSAIVNYLIYSHYEAYLGDENIAIVRKEIIGAHTSILAIIVGALFAKSKDEPVKTPLAVMAISFCLAWSLYISDTWRCFPSMVTANGHNGLIEQFAERSTELSTVMAGILGYLCKKRSA